MHAHAESVLSLFLSEDKQLLFSSGVDSVVNVRHLFFPSLDTPTE